jgi:hypothetical protein
VTPEPIAPDTKDWTWVLTRPCPATVATELFDAANVVADSYANVPADAWIRRGLRSNGSEFSIATISIYHLHDIVHHAYDVSR